MNSYADFIDHNTVVVVVRCELEVDVRALDVEDVEAYAKDLVLRKLDMLREELGPKVLH